MPRVTQTGGVSEGALNLIHEPIACARIERKKSLSLCSGEAQTFAKTRVSVHGDGYFHGRGAVTPRKYQKPWGMGRVVRGSVWRTASLSRENV